MTLQEKLVHALTAYDRKQSTKRGYNPNALGIYFQRIDDVIADIDRGADPRAAIVAGFTGRVQDAALRGAGLALGSDQEVRGGSITYQPARPNPAGANRLIGEMVKVAPGSGIDSGKIGTVVKVRTRQTAGGLIPDYPGEYAPLRANWFAVQFEDGTTATFPASRLKRITARHEAREFLARPNPARGATLGGKRLPTEKRSAMPEDYYEKHSRLLRASRRARGPAAFRAARRLTAHEMNFRANPARGLPSRPRTPPRANPALPYSPGCQVRVFTRYGNHYQVIVKQPGHWDAYNWKNGKGEFAGAMADRFDAKVIGTEIKSVPDPLFAWIKGLFCSKGAKANPARGNLEPVKYKLPAYWASYLINGDDSGIDPADKAAADRFLKSENLPGPVDVGDSYFSHRNDAGTLAGDVAEYTFLIKRK
jgi:hypothetical protein